MTEEIHYFYAPLSRRSKGFEELDGFEMNLAYYAELCERQNVKNRQDLVLTASCGTQLIYPVGFFGNWSAWPERVTCEKCKEDQQYQWMLLRTVEL